VLSGTGETGDEYTRRLATNPRLLRHPDRPRTSWSTTMSSVNPQSPLDFRQQFPLTNVACFPSNVALSFAFSSLSAPVVKRRSLLGPNEASRVQLLAGVLPESPVCLLLRRDTRTMRLQTLTPHASGPDGGSSHVPQNGPRRPGPPRPPRGV